MVGGTCPADRFDLASATVVTDATAPLNDWLNSEYTRIRVTQGMTLPTIIYQFPANTCYRLDGSNKGGLVVAGMDNIVLQGGAYTQTVPNDNSDVFGIPLVTLPNRDANGNPYPKVTVTTVFRVIRNLALTEVKSTCIAWSISTGCYSSRRHIWLQNDTNVTLRSLRVEGNNLTWDQQVSSDPNDNDDYGTYKSYWEFEHAFAVDGVTNFVGDNLQARGIYGDGFASQGKSDGVVLTSFRVSYNGRQGVSLSSVSNVVVDNAQILNTRRSGFDLEPIAVWRVKTVTIKNSYIRGYSVAFASGGSGHVDDVLVQNNKIAGNGVPWITVSDTEGDRRYDWKVYGNQVLNGLGSSQPTMRFANVTNVDIALNASRASSSQGRKGIGLTGVDGTVIIVGNDLGWACSVYTGIVTGTVAVSGNIIKTSGCP